MSATDGGPLTPSQMDLIYEIWRGGDLGYLEGQRLVDFAQLHSMNYIEIHSTHLEVTPVGELRLLARMPFFIKYGKRSRGRSTANL